VNDFLSTDKYRHPPLLGRFALSTAMQGILTAERHFEAPPQVTQSRFHAVATSFDKEAHGLHITAPRPQERAATN
jgi:hypothetical protein